MLANVAASIRKTNGESVPRKVIGPHSPGTNDHSDSRRATLDALKPLSLPFPNHATPIDSLGVIIPDS